MPSNTRQEQAAFGLSWSPLTRSIRSLLRIQAPVSRQRSRLIFSSAFIGRTSHALRRARAVRDSGFPSLVGLQKPTGAALNCSTPTKRATPLLFFCLAPEFLLLQYQTRYKLFPA